MQQCRPLTFCMLDHQMYSVDTVESRIPSGPNLHAVKPKTLLNRVFRVKTLNRVFRVKTLNRVFRVFG